VSNPVPDGYRLVDGPPSVGDYLELRERAGPLAQARRSGDRIPTRQLGGLPRPLLGDELAVAMGRLIGDGGWYFHVIDMAVLPEHQRRGLGSAVLDHLLAEVRRRAPRGAYVNLLADSALGGQLYARRGFAETAPEAIRNGPTCWTRR
jgi:GNAT superfamily N-acetyltransferase